MATSTRQVYSPQRLRLVLFLLTAATLPVVIGCAVLIYYYLRFSVMVERRLQGERWLVPARLYARPLVLRPGLPLGVARPRQGPERPEVRGEARHPGRARRVRGRQTSTVTFTPRGSRRRAASPSSSTFEKDRVKEMRGLRSKRSLRDPDPRAGADHVPLRREPREEAHRAVTRSCPTTSSRRCWPSRTAASSAIPASTPSASSAPRVRNIKADTYIQGGSTITQQLVQELLPHPGADVPPQGPGGAARLRARAARAEEGHPRAVPERGLPRPGRLVQHQRDRRGGARCTSTRTWATSPSRRPRCWRA